MSNVKFCGTTRDNLKEVSEKFRKLLSKESAGLALAVYKDDELIVDLWGGFANKKESLLWEENTLTVTFSTSKVIGALIVAILVSRGQLRYEDLVIKYWPEFGQNGKESTTIEWVVAHKAGVITFDEDLSLEQCKDPTYVSRVIEKTKPRWTPGTVTAYHVLTYGLLIDQIIRRADPKKRGIGDFFRQEIGPFMKDKDFYIGLPVELRSRMATVKGPRNLELLKVLFTDTVYLEVFLNTVKSGYMLCNSPLHIAGRYPSCLNLMKPSNYNKPEVWELENVSALGIGTARGLASAISAILQNNLINAEVWEKLSQPTEYVKDEVIQLKYHRGHGFFYKPHPTRINSYLLEHIGYGNQKVIFDPKLMVSVALLRNGLSWDVRKDRETDRIAQMVINSLNGQ